MSGQEKELTRLVGLRVSNLVVKSNKLKLKNLIDIFKALPKDTTLCGLRIDNKANCSYWFFHSKKFPHVPFNKKVPFLEPEFIGKGENIKLKDVGLPSHFEC